MDFIIDYICAYEKKIQHANSRGLFDNAKLFELFAQEICTLWYGMPFINLNDIEKDYPCVDLLSEDRSLYVQVSTQKDIFGKIKNTLKALATSKREDLKKINVPVFFVLSNESEDKVSDLDGDNKIGRFSFHKEDQFISTARIIAKAKSDL